MSDDVSVEVQLTINDKRALARSFNSDPFGQTRHRLYWTLRGILWWALIFAAIKYPVMWIAVAIEVGVVVVERRALRQQLQQLDALNGRYSIAANGLSRSSARSETTVFWAFVEGLTQTSDYVIIRLAGTAWILPCRCFGSESHREQFLAALRQSAKTAT